MRRLLVGFAILVTSVARAATVENDWVKVEHPDLYDPTQELVVKVTVKESAPGEDVAVHLHWMKAAGWGGFMAWHPSYTAEKGKSYAFRFKTKAPPGLDRISAIVFRAPKGDFKLKTKELACCVPLPTSAFAKGGKGLSKPVSSYPVRPNTVTFKKSFIWLTESPKPTRVGEDLVLKVSYFLDASDTWGDKPTKLMCMPLGPWIDNPDGVINKTRHHVGYPGVGTQFQDVQVGEHVATFRWKLNGAFRYNTCTFLCKFKTPDGKDWPWEWRGGDLKAISPIKGVRLSPQARGGLFFVGETPRISLAWGEGVDWKGEAKAVVRDALGAIILTKSFSLDAAKGDTMIELDDLKQRGVFSLEMEAAGVREFCYFGVIPRFLRRTEGPTCFGVTNVSDPELSSLAADMGFSLVRHFVEWKGLQPAPERWNFDYTDRAVRANVDAGLKPWICLYDPPAWVLPAGVFSAGFEPSPFDLKLWSSALEHLAKRYPNQLHGFEFLNEIVPGSKCSDPVREYVDICRVGYETVKGVDSNLVCQLAGGLWPHTYRIDLLNAGVGKYADILPVHYSTYEGVREAADDLAVRGIASMQVADNETASGMTVWEMPPELAFKRSLGQCEYVMKRWPDVLTAGAKFVCYFGGNADACGNWSYLLAKDAPRPVAATLAVVQGKLAYAHPVGKFYLGKAACHLFEKESKAILFVTVPGEKDASVSVPALGELVVTDFQGNEIKVKDGVVRAGDMPVIVEGGDLEMLKLHAALSVGVSAPCAVPQHVASSGLSVSVPVSVCNADAEQRSFSLRAEAPGWGTVQPLELSLKAHERRAVSVVFSVKDGMHAAARTELKMTLSDNRGHSVVKPYVLCVTDPAAFANLLKNPGFDGDCKPWGGACAVDAPVPGDQGNRALVLNGKGRDNWQSAWQNVTSPLAGEEMLYSCWVRGEGMGGGSNFSASSPDGRKRGFHMLQIFSVGESGTRGWRYLSKVFRPLEGGSSFTAAPVAQGPEGARMLFDNAFLGIYRGSAFVAEADGSGGFGSPIPLLCDNQVRGEDGYAWTEKNLAGVSRFAWSPQVLKLELSVEDDMMDVRSVVSSSGEETLDGDALALCLFPKTGANGRPSGEQVRWYISKASPGGGSGTATLFRPAKYSLGAKAGQLCKDSSVYELEISREGTLTHYRLSIPWTEIPGFAPAVGASLGCNLVLFDRDGGRARGWMTWGGGLKDDAADCGLLTLGK